MDSGGALSSRWIEDFEQSLKQTDDSRFLDEAWISKGVSRSKGWNALVPPRSLLSGSEIQGWFVRYPALCVVPALVIGTLAFLLVVGLMIH
jgi:hypothetical protein